MKTFRHETNGRGPRRVLRLGMAIASASGAWLLEPARLSAQCAMCRTSLTNSAEGPRWALGMNQGIIFLIAVPFLIVGSILLFIFRPEVVEAAYRLRRFLLRQHFNTVYRLD